MKLRRIDKQEMVWTSPVVKVPVQVSGWTLQVGPWDLTVTHTDEPVIPEAFRDTVP